jgi:STE24 endopeptidase
VTRRRLLLGGLLGLLGAGVAVTVLTPWQVLPAGSPPVNADVREAFSPAEVARVARFRADLGAWPYAGILVGVLTPWVAVAASTGRGMGRSRPSHGSAGLPGGPPKAGRTLLLAAGVAAAVVLASWLLTLPMAAHSEMVLRRYGLSTQTWAGWLRDRLVGVATSAAVAVLAVVLIWWLVRQAPTRWPWLLAAVAAAVTVAGSALYPLVVEPLYTHVAPLPAGQLRERIEQLAARDGFGEVRVVVSNASSRTTGENAHVSGLGATRRVDLDDTLVARAGSDPDAVVSVVAHELGHVRHHDVARGTVLGALGASGTVLLVSRLLTGRRGRRLFDPDSTRPRDVVRSVALLLAVAATAPYVAAPVTTLVSRRIEAAADVHALQLTGDVAAFRRMQHDLAMSNLIRLRSSWWQTMLFATHPAPAWRIAMAEAWAGGPGAHQEARSSP